MSARSAGVPWGLGGGSTGVGGRGVGDGGAPAEVAGGGPWGRGAIAHIKLTGGEKPVSSATSTAESVTPVTSSATCGGPLLQGIGALRRFPRRSSGGRAQLFQAERALTTWTRRCRSRPRVRPSRVPSPGAPAGGRSGSGASRGGTGWRPTDVRAEVPGSRGAGGLVKPYPRSLTSPWRRTGAAEPRQGVAHVVGAACYPDSGCVDRSSWNPAVPATSRTPSHRRAASSPVGTREMTGPKKAVRPSPSACSTAITGVPT